MPDGYWDLRTEPVVVDGMYWPTTACRRCGKRFAPYMEAVPTEDAGNYCWGHCAGCDTLRGQLAALVARIDVAAKTYADLRDAAYSGVELAAILRALVDGSDA